VLRFLSKGETNEPGPGRSSYWVVQLSHLVLTILLALLLQLPLLWVEGIAGVMLPLETLAG
jgi:hypothetical protein